jgi:hypothetical protein
MIESKKLLKVLAARERASASPRYDASMDNIMLVGSSATHHPLNRDRSFCNVYWFNSISGVIGHPLTVCRMLDLYTGASSGVS